MTLHLEPHLQKFLEITPVATEITIIQQMNYALNKTSLIIYSSNKSFNN